MNILSLFKPWENVAHSNRKPKGSVSGMED